MKVAFLFNKGRLRRLDSVRHGKGSSEFFYGALELEKSGCEIGYFEVDPNWAPGIVGGLVNILGEKGMAPEKMTGGVLFQVKALLDELQKFDVIVCTTSGIGFAVSCWQCLRKVSPPIITIHCGLFNNKYNFFRRMITSFLLSKMHTVLFGDAELEPILQKFSGAHNRVTVSQFGVDAQFWHPVDTDKSDYILSVGNDGRRDFDTLIRAASNIPVEIKILTSRILPHQLPDNITLIKSSWHKETVSDEDLRDLYQHAKCVVITLCDSLQPSGQSVALQAMACGCPVVLTETKGLWSKEIMIDNHNIVFVPVADADAVAMRVRRVLNDTMLHKKLVKNGRLTVVNQTNAVGFAETMAAVCKKQIL